MTIKRVCFCPETIRWMMRHLKKSALPAFRLLIATGSIKKVVFAQKRKLFKKSKRSFSRKQLAAQRLFAKRARAGTLQGRVDSMFVKARGGRNIPRRRKGVRRRR